MQRLVDKEVVKAGNIFKDKLRTKADVLTDKMALVTLYKACHSKCVILDNEVMKHIERYDKNTFNSNLEKLRIHLHESFNQDGKIVSLPLIVRKDSNQIYGSKSYCSPDHEFVISATSNRIALDMLKYTAKYLYETIGNKTKTWSNKYANYVQPYTSRYAYLSESWSILHKKPEFIYTGLALKDFTPDSKINIISPNPTLELTDVDDFIKVQYVRLATMDHTKLFNDIKVTERNLLGYIIPTSIIPNLNTILGTTFEKLIDPVEYEYVTDEVTSNDIDRFIKMSKDLTAANHPNLGTLPMFISVDDTPLLHSNVKSITYPIHPTRVYNFLADFVFGASERLHQDLYNNIMFVYNPYLKKTYRNIHIGLDKKYHIDGEMIKLDLKYDNNFCKQMSRATATEVYNIGSYITYTEKYIFRKTGLTMWDVKRIYAIPENKVITTIHEMFELGLDITLDDVTFDALDKKEKQLINLIREYRFGYRIAMDHMRNALRYYTLLGFSLDFLFSYMLNYNRKGVVFIPKQNKIVYSNFREVITKTWRIPMISLDYELAQPELANYLDTIGNMYVEDVELEHKFIENDLYGYMNALITDDAEKFDAKVTVKNMIYDKTYKDWSYKASHGVDVEVIKAMYVVHISLSRRYDNIYGKITKLRKERKEIVEALVSCMNNILTSSRRIIELEAKNSINKHLINLNEEIRMAETLCNSCLGTNNISDYVKSDMTIYFGNLGYLTRALLTYLHK